MDYEYKVIHIIPGQGALIGSKPDDKRRDVERQLNEQAADGWRVAWFHWEKLASYMAVAVLERPLP